jgi:hypothetical protein
MIAVAVIASSSKRTPSGAGFICTASCRRAALLLLHVNWKPVFLLKLPFFFLLNAANITFSMTSQKKPQAGHTVHHTNHDKNQAGQLFVLLDLLKPWLWDAFCKRARIMRSVQNHSSDQAEAKRSDMICP